MRIALPLTLGCLLSVLLSCAGSSTPERSAGAALAVVVASTAKGDPARAMCKTACVNKTDCVGDADCSLEGQRVAFAHTTPREESSCSLSQSSDPDSASFPSALLGVTLLALRRRKRAG